MAAVVRQLFRRCCKLRSILTREDEGERFDESLAALNTLIAISGSYFGQGEYYCVYDERSSHGAEDADDQGDVVGSGDEEEWEEGGEDYEEEEEEEGDEEDEEGGYGDFDGAFQGVRSGVGVVGSTVHMASSSCSNRSSSSSSAGFSLTGMGGGRVGMQQAREEGEELEDGQEQEM